MRKGPRLLAIGGGGVTHGTDHALDDLLLELCRKPAPRIGYVGLANLDDPQRLARIRTRFTSAGHLPIDTPRHDAIRWIERQDVIYVGGGNTARLIDGLRDRGVVDALLRAARGGTLLAGVSAGAVCWFEQALSDSTGQGLAPLAGLGLFSGSCCPHYSTEPARREAFPAAIADGTLKDGIAIDDGVAVLLAPDAPPRALAARAGAWAYQVTRTGRTAVTTRLPPLGRG